MSPAYPKTDSEADRAAADRYHAMNNVFFLEATMHGRYPKAFVGENDRADKIGLDQCAEVKDFKI